MKVHNRVPFILILILVFNTIHVKAQDLSIQKVNLKDSVVRNEILNIFDKLANTDSIFKRGYGYLTLDFQAYGKGDTTSRYLISPQIRRFDEGSLFPLQYTIITKRLILLYNVDSAMYIDLKFSLSEKRKFIRLVEKDHRGV
jgi:hypothetical protein